MSFFSIVITNRYIAKQITDLSINPLVQVRETLDNLFLDIHDLDASVSTNFGMQVTLKKMLAGSRISYHDNLVLNLISHSLIAKTASNPVIHSIYLYFENHQNRFFTSDLLRIADSSQYYDTEWLDLLQRKISRWTGPRQVKLNTVENNVTLVTSFHNTFWKNGIIVTNISVSSVSRILSQVERMPSQSLVVTSSDGQILFFCNNFTKLPEKFKVQLSSVFDTTVLKIDGKKYRIFRLYSPETELNYLSIIPQYQLDLLPRGL
jgi:two-component system sensor histidine kinase YesM